MVYCMREENHRRYMHGEGRTSHWDTGPWRMRFGQKGWLRPMVIQMLEEKPMNGIDIINRIHEMSHGWWRPSPGSVYPLLETLRNENLVEKHSDGKYELSKKYLENSKYDEILDDSLVNLESDISYLEDIAQEDKKRLSAYADKIKGLAGRLSKLS